MTRRNLVVDAAVALVVFGLSLGVLAAGGLGTPEPDVRPLDVAGTVLAGASALPLLAWRRAPLTAFVGTCVATVAMVALRYPVDFPFGPVVALYLMAVSYSGDARPALRRAAIAATASFVPIAAAVRLAGDFDVRALLPGLTFWALILLGVWIAGEHTRLRRERIAELEEQAARRDRERVRERRLAAAEDRTRIARELHDSAGHAINVILVQAGAARLLHDRDPDASRRAIATVEDVARSTLTEIDQFVHALRHNGEDARDDLPVPVDPAALDDLLARHRASGLTIAADVRGERRGLPRSVTWAAYRILQEALTNAARHGCGSAELHMAFDADAVDITVTNPTANGSLTGGGHGVIGMRERAMLLGGAFDAGPHDGVFRLHAHLPRGMAT